MRLLFPVLLISLICHVNPAAAQEFLPRAETGLKLGTKRTVLLTEFWAPFSQDDDSVAYGDMRFMADDDNNTEGNLGIGYRKIL